MKLTPEFKQVISNLSSAEKDKLIFRLIKKDITLANQIIFEFLDEDTVEDKRQIVEKEMKIYIEKTQNRFYSPGILLQETKYISGKINEHVSITKDKFGETYLNLMMLVETLEKNTEKLNKYTYGDCYTFYIYVVARTYKVLAQIKAMHEDLHLEFNELLERLQAIYPEHPHLMRLAINNMLDINWFSTDEIPDNLVQVQKELRANGFLR